MLAVYNKQAITEKSFVEMQERPVIRTLQAKVTPPAYTGLPSLLLNPNDGEISTLEGSAVTLNIETDKQLSHAEIIFGDSSRLPMEIAGHTANRSFTIRTSTTYYLKIFDKDSIDNDSPINYGIYIIPDEFPFAEIKQPAADVDLQGELSFPLIAELRDDFGFSALKLKGSVFRQGTDGDSTGFEIPLSYEVTDKGLAIPIIEETSCTGCHLCVDICPVDCIYSCTELGEREEVEA